MIQVPTKNQLLKRVLEFRIDHSVDVIKLVNSIGIQVYSVEKIQGSANITYEKATGEYCIFVNENEPITRQRFSIAHELAHLVLHPGTLHEIGILNRNADAVSIEMENEADKFAAEILMPEEIVDSFLSDNSIDVDDIKKTEIKDLAECFKVSNFVAVLRLRELGYHVPYIDFA